MNRNSENMYNQGADRDQTRGVEAEVKSHSVHTRTDHRGRQVFVVSCWRADECGVV